MNERIQQMIHSLNEKEGVHWINEDKIKFAELIVKDCAETVQDFADHRFPASEYPSRLKKYFGVEE